MATSTEQPKQSNPLAVGNSSVVNSEALIVVNDVKLILPPPPSTPTLSQQRNVMLHQQRLSRSSVMLPDTVTATRPPSAPISEYAPPGQRVNNTVVTTIPRLHSLSADNTAAEINQPVEKLPPTRSSPRPSALSEETSSVTSDSTESSEESAPQIVITDSAGHSVQKTATEAETDGNKKDIEMDVFSRHSFEWVGPRISSEGARPSLELLRRARIRPVYHPYYFRQFVTEHMPAKGTVVVACSFYFVLTAIGGSIKHCQLHISVWSGLCSLRFNLSWPSFWNNHILCCCCDNGFYVCKILVINIVRH